MARCCCGKFADNEDEGLTVMLPWTHNDITHTVLGPSGNFCGPKNLHTIKHLEAQVKVLEDALKDYGQHTDTCGRRQIGTINADPECTCGLDAALEVK